MNKFYCSPYKIYTDWQNDRFKQSWDFAYCRYILNDDTRVAGIVWQDQDYNWRTSMEKFSTLEDAMEYQDRHLIKNGAVFLTDEQFNRLEILK